MIDVAQAIQALDSNAQFVVTGNPSNEAEYKANVKFVSGADENGSAIFKDARILHGLKYQQNNLSYKLTMKLKNISDKEKLSSIKYLSVTN